jgi:hypothetical protein
MGKAGGARENAGRKSKAEEQSLIEKLTPLEPLAFAALQSALEDGKDWAVKLFFQYNFGMPKQIVLQENLNYEVVELTPERAKEVKKIFDADY